MTGVTHNMSSSSRARTFVQIVFLKNFYTIVNHCQLVLLMKDQPNNSFNLSLNFTHESNISIYNIQMCRSLYIGMHVNIIDRKYINREQ